MEFVPVDKKEFVEVEIDISDIISEEELIEKINILNYDDNKYYKIILIGNKQIEVNVNKILKNVNILNVMKVKDNTKLKIDLENISKQNSLKGIFVKDLLERLEKEPENKDTIMRAIEIGLHAFENGG